MFKRLKVDVKIYKKIFLSTNHGHNGNNFIEVIHYFFTDQNISILIDKQLKFI